MLRRFTALLILLIIAVPTLADEFRMCNWNVLNFSSSSAASRVPYFRTVLADIEPDLVVVQEMSNQTSANYFRTQILNYLEPGEWSLAPYHNSYDTDRALFIKSDIFDVLDNGFLDTDLRDIEWWDLEVTASGDTFRLYSMHLKASSGSSNAARRLAEVTVLREHSDLLAPGTNFLVAGDFNLYTSGEAAYGKLLEPGNGQFHDPINRPGNWHDSYTFRHIHTQSTRTSLSGGATGGLDDRFDFILASQTMLDGAGLDLVDETYIAYGNDGAHLNRAITYNGNTAVGDVIAEALRQSSDHLPVIVQIEYEDAIAVPVAAPDGLHLSAWPNPFNPTTTLNFSIPVDGRLRLEIFDVSGRRQAVLVDEFSPAGSYNFDWQADGLSAGLYMARLSLNGEPQATTRLVLLK
ncbi:MAG: T9SS type A sorting domain-containing protein [bacterium]|nr:T9SS type A sorting domain-containing protein [bacterium]